jgi:hypothetical protein
MKKIAGNILIMISHNDPTYGNNSIITVQLDESIDDFIGPSTVHILHITRTDNTTAAIGKVPVLFILKDYKRTTVLDISTMPALEMIKNKSTYVGDSWSIVFEM